MSKKAKYVLMYTVDILNKDTYLDTLNTDPYLLCAHGQADKIHRATRRDTDTDTERDRYRHGETQIQGVDTDTPSA